MRHDTLDRELARLAPVPGHDAVARARVRVMAEVARARTTPLRHDVARSPGRRRIAARIGLAGALAAASVAGVTLWPDARVGGWVPAAYAAWRAVPEPVPPADAAALGRACTARVAAAEAAGVSHPQVHDARPVVAERRGTWTLTLIAGESADGLPATLTCLASDDATAGGGFGVDTGPARGLEEPGGLRWVRAGSGHDWFDVWGYVGSDVARVTATLANGTVVEATVADGWFVAWWPSPTTRDPEPATLTWYLADGSTAGSTVWEVP